MKDRRPESQHIHFIIIVSFLSLPPLHTHQANLFEQDFLQERRDREIAHNLKEEIRLTCDQRVHAIDIECNELTRRNEILVRELTELIKTLDQKKEDLEAIKTESEATPEQNGVSEDRLKELTQQLEEAQAEVTNTKKGLSDIENDNSFLRGEVIQCQQRAAEAKERAEFEREKFDQILRDRKQRASEEIVSFRQQISEAEKTARVSEEKRKKNRVSYRGKGGYPPSGSNFPP